MNNYFSHDSNARNSGELLPVRMKYGAEGYGVYFMLLERLREEDDYMSVKDYNMVAFDLRVDTSLLKAIIEDFGLFVFTDDGKYFYSEGFLKRMELKDVKSKKRSEAGKKGAAKRWNNTTNEVDTEENSNAIAMPSKKIARKVKESKGKKSKGNTTVKDEQPSQSFDEFNIYSFVEQNFNRTLSPIELETLGHWLNEYNIDLIKEAVKRTVLKNKYTIGYVEGILRDWEKNNITTLGMVQEQDDNWSKKQTSYSKRPTRKETVPDVFNEKHKETALSAEEQAEIEAKLRQFTGG